jgi:hypothetical protein
MNRTVKLSTDKLFEWARQDQLRWVPREDEHGIRDMYAGPHRLTDECKLEVMAMVKTGRLIEIEDGEYTRYRLPESER